MEAIGRVTSTVAQDFTKVNQAVLRCTDLLLRRMCPTDTNRETVSQIQKSIEQANTLTRQLLGLSRKRAIERKVVSLNNIVNETNSLLKRVVGELVRLTVSLSEKPVFTEADPTQLQQILINLATNARDAMGGTGELKIETNIADFTDAFCPGTLKPGSYVVLRVTDNGCGMHPEVLAKIFEPFFTTKDPSQQTGLGLSTVQDIVQLSGGDIVVYSTPGRGTTFTIFLPAVAPPFPMPDRDAITIETASKQNTGTETILLVEDEELVRTLLADVLKKEGYHVICAIDGMQALNIARTLEGPLDLVVTDLMMPELPGWQLVDRLSKSRGELPVLFISGFTNDEIAHRTTNRPGVDLLQKPFSSEIFLAKIRQMLDQHQLAA